MPKRNTRSPKRNGGNLRVRLREVEPHSKGNRNLNREDNRLISEEIMLMRTLFLIPEVEDEAEEESSHVLHVERMGTSHLNVQRKNNPEEKLTSLKRRSVMLNLKMQKAKDCLECIKFS